MTLHLILPPNLFEVIERAGISSAKQILLLSIWDIKKLTNLCIDDILLLKNIVSDYVSPSTITGNLIKNNNIEVPRVSTGCTGIDTVLKGGLRRGTITEVYGESGCGKTQLALQTTLYNWDGGCVYICTEDSFPAKRFEEIKTNLPMFNSKIDYGKHIFVEHLTEANDLLSCISVRFPRLLTQMKLSLIVVDSVTAPFRCETTNYVKRAENLREIAIILTSIAQEHNIAILCINQVTASFEDTENVIPSLGLAWSNMVTTRLMVKKTSKIADGKCLLQDNNHLTLKQNICLRELTIVFAPDLPSTMVEFVITSNGVQSLHDYN